MGKKIPIVDYLVLDDGAAAPRGVASRSSSGALYFDRRNADAKRGGTEFKRRKLADDRQGAHRSRSCTGRARACPTPYVSALVDLDGGGVVKAQPPQRRARPRARASSACRCSMTTFVAGTDDDGTEAIAFAFEPAS